MKLITILMTAFILVGSSAFAGPKGGECKNEEKKAAIEAAFQNNDYDAWRKAMNGNKRILEKVTKENFARFAEARKLMREGKRDEAAKIQKELGFGPGAGFGPGHAEGPGPGHCGKHQSQ